MPSIYGRSPQLMVGFLILLASVGCGTVTRAAQLAVSGVSRTPMQAVTPTPDATPLLADLSGGSVQATRTGDPRFESRIQRTVVVNPKWVDDLIAQWQRDPVSNPPRAIYRGIYRGNMVFYVGPLCCDQFSRLYDEQGQVLCAPDGGLTGKGDGKCSDFARDGQGLQLIWKDNRTR